MRIAALALAVVVATGCAAREESTLSEADTLSGAPLTPDSVTPGPAAPTPGTIPSTEASISGTITAVEGVRLRVETDPQSPSGSPKASIRVEGTTTILRRTGEVAQRGDLKLGGRVSVWFDGPVMESYPVQALAGTVVIEPDSL